MQQAVAFGRLPLERPSGLSIDIPLIGRVATNADMVHSFADWEMAPRRARQGGREMRLEEGAMSTALARQARGWG